ncbi:outer membrane beta-barrel protein [uncultured Mucilaginibacter sp.]|uniref:outer membrane beta-barrel protein n=1 Tax=uncultured Mucilaginibacter sp. TaxID=797541 RepID=UPI0025FE0FE3|nr:outer membrane beta-barrel protein [uncultured Mucilaginibacter sp.]
MKLFYLFIAAFLIGANTYAQTGRDVHGTVTDSAKVTLPGSIVRLITATDSISTATDARGAFVFKGVKAAQFSLVVQSIGFNPVIKRIALDNSTEPVFLRPIILKPSSQMLKEVTISDVLPVKIKEDTVEFNAAAYKVRDGAPIEDVIKKVPGADVDANGNVTFQGKSVTKVRVNGKDFFGGDLKTATQNLPADAVQNVQFVNDYGDQANLTGIKTGEPETILNINIKASRNHGVFGQVSGGGGQDAIPQVDGTKDAARYIAQANMFNFDGNRQIAILANYNNTNTSLFNFGGPGGGGGGRGGPGGPPGGGNNTNGITTARSIGLNYRDTWSKKLTVYGSYSFTDNTVNTISSTQQTNFQLAGKNITNSTNNQTDNKINHRFTFNMEYRPDTLNYFKISPSYSFAGVHSTQASTYRQMVADTTALAYNTAEISRSSSPNYGINVLYNHRFNSHGRNFSINVGVGRSTNDQYANPDNTYFKITTAPTTPADQFITTNANTDTLGTYVSYIEPIGKRSYVELNYNYRHSYTTSDKQTDYLDSAGRMVEDPTLSNNYNYTFVTNRIGLNYRFVEKKYNYVLGVTAQPSQLEGSTPNVSPKNSFDFSPNAHFIYNFSRTQSFSANFSGSSVMPSYTQLQPVPDLSNALYPVIGNPNLNPQYNNTFSLRYNHFNFESGNVFFSNLSFTQANNYIASNTIYYPELYTPNKNLSKTTATSYQNTDGYYSTSAFFVFAKPWEKRKYNLFLIGNYSYSNNISYITDIAPVTFAENREQNIAKTLTASQGIRFRLDITDIIDAEANTTYSINSSQNSIPQAGLLNNYRSWVVGLNGKNYLFKDWTYSYDYSKTFYYNYPGAKNPNVFNTYLERRFLKGNMATLRFSVLDVFNQNTGYSSNQTSSYTSTTNYNRLGRYYLLTFTYRFSKMAGKAPERGPGRGFGPPGGGPGGPGGGPGGPMF